LVEALEALSVIFHADTHVAIWLRMGDAKRLRPIRQHLARKPFVLSPFVVLELQMLYEIGRLRETARWIVDQLAKDHGVEVVHTAVDAGAARALDLSFTRDPFDRLIAGHALASGATLFTADESLLAHVSCARWG
jgi:PIN domain nuclease of toxin-antitoxin system